MSGPRWICKPERAATSCRHSTDANLGGYKNPGHLIRTQGGGGATLTGLGVHPVGWICNRPPIANSIKQLLEGGVRKLCLVHGQQ